MVFLPDFIKAKENIRLQGGRLEKGKYKQASFR